MKSPAELLIALGAVLLAGYLLAAAWLGAGARRPDGGRPAVRAGRGLPAPYDAEDPSKPPRRGSGSVGSMSPIKVDAPARPPRKRPTPVPAP